MATESAQSKITPEEAAGKLYDFMDELCRSCNGEINDLYGDPPSPSDLIDDFAEKYNLDKNTWGEYLKGKIAGLEQTGEKVTMHQVLNAFVDASEFLPDRDKEKSGYDETHSANDIFEKIDGDTIASQTRDEVLNDTKAVADLLYHMEHKPLMARGHGTVQDHLERKKEGVIDKIDKIAPQIIEDTSGAVKDFTEDVIRDTKQELGLYNESINHYPVAPEHQEFFASHLLPEDTLDLQRDMQHYMNAKIINDLFPEDGIALRKMQKEIMRKYDIKDFSNEVEKQMNAQNTPESLKKSMEVYESYLEDGDKNNLEGADADFAAIKAELAADVNLFLMAKHGMSGDDLHEAYDNYNNDRCEKFAEELSNSMIENPDPKALDKIIDLDQKTPDVPPSFPDMKI